ncbi:MAG: hypothetical protein A2Y10_05165 [Planctomycetes bacterium GWF2_41_51]|nr:MAG: hypothetical protein A2Y10_05165 [Planctomycetes bacterium GWF2_41_51]HBG25545.1 hypothetical protein [Phycisphaerales bacterium]
MEMIGFMATWTTYGTWLPGDERGYVDNKGQLQKGDPKLFQKSKELQKEETVKLNAAEKKIAKQIILDEALRINHQIIALAVCSNHVHLLAKSHQDSIDNLINRYKSLTTRAFWEYGRKGKIWTRGFDKQFCFTEKELAARIVYIHKHKE